LFHQTAQGMATTKTIAIIGAEGKIGSSIARSLSSDTSHLILMAKNPDLLISLKDELLSLNPILSIDLQACAKEASWEADIIIIATPPETEQEIAGRIQEVATGKIVISVTTPVCRFNNLLNPSFAGATEELQEILPFSKGPLN
jgi:hypothetical protein